MAFVGANVVGAVRGSLGQQCPEPNGEVAHVKPGAAGCAVAFDVDGFVLQGGVEEVADSEVGVQREVRADEGEAAGDDGLQGCVVGVGDAEVFGHAFGLVVGAGELQRVGGTGVGFGGVEECRAAPVHGACGGEEQAGGAGLAGEVEDVTGAVEDAFGKLIGGAGGLLAAGVGGRVEDVGVGFGGVAEGADVALKEGDGGVESDVGGGEVETGGAAGEDGGVEVQGEFAVGVE